MSESQNLRDVLVIGGGCSAIAVAAALLQRNPTLSVTLAERSSRVGEGVAYGTESDHHILNVRAKAMGIFDEEPEHFLKWALRSGFNFAPDEFVARRVYAKYLEHLLNNHILPSAVEKRNVELWRGEIVELVREGDRCRARAETGALKQFRYAIIATGHTPLQVPVRRILGKEDSRLIKNPWGSAGYEGLESISRIAIIGSGLTALDVVGALDKLGYKGAIDLFSRRGLLPLAATGSGKAVEVSFDPTKQPRALRALIRSLRGEFQRLDSIGADWRPLIDAIRPHIPVLWGRFDVRERGRFLRHLRPFWEVIRHRMPNEINERVQQLRRDGRLTVRRGRIDVLDFSGNDSLVLTASRSGVSESYQFDRVYNCSGSAALRSDALPPLLASLRQQELIQLDPFGLGGYTSMTGNLLDTHNQPVNNIYAIGPFRRASEWESTAVPEIRKQARLIAEDILISA